MMKTQKTHAGYYNRKQHNTRTSNPSIRYSQQIFFSGTGNDRITSNVYEMRTFPDKATILKKHTCKASHPDNHPTIQLIPYRIQEITNKYIYQVIIKK